MKKIFIATSLFLFSNLTMAASTVQIADAAYLNGDAITRVGYSETLKSLVINIIGEKPMQFRGFTKQQAMALNKKIILGKPSTIVDMRKK